MPDSARTVTLRRLALAALLTCLLVMAPAAHAHSIFRTPSGQTARGVAKKTARKDCGASSIFVVCTTVKVRFQDTYADEHIVWFEATVNTFPASPRHLCIQTWHRPDGGRIYGEILYRGTC